jgi:hypothetical protein
MTALAVRARNVVDSGLCTRTSAVPDWLARLDQLEHLTAAPAADRRATLAILEDHVVCDLLVLSYLRHGTPYALWADTLSGFAEDVLKPGGHLAAFGATRTYHRMAVAVAVEDAGFEIRDSLHWLYGTGFPKGQDVGKLIDRRRDDHPARRRFTAEFAALRDAAGWTNPQIDALFGYNGMAQHWTTQRKTAAVPTVEQWKRLKADMGFEAPAALEDLVHELNGRKNTPRRGVGGPGGHRRGAPGPRRLRSVPTAPVRHVRRDRPRDRRGRALGGLEHRSQARP